MAPVVKMLYLKAPVVPTFPKPSVAQLLLPNVAGPATKLPLSASSQHEGTYVVKSSNEGTVNTEQAVVKFNGPTQPLKSPPPQEALTQAS